MRLCVWLSARASCVGVACLVRVVVGVYLLVDRIGWLVCAALRMYFASCSVSPRFFAILTWSLFSRDVNLACKWVMALRPSVIPFHVLGDRALIVLLRLS